MAPFITAVYNDLGKRTNVNICQGDHIDRLKGVINGYRLSANQRKALEGLRFDKCELP